MRLGWEVKSLSDVCDFQNGFAFKSKTFKDNGIPIIRITNIQNEKIDISKVVYIDSKDYRQDLTKYEVIKNDLLIAMSGATTGKIGIYDGEEKLLLNQRVGKFIPKNLLDKMFLFYYLATKVEESLEISAGSAQPNLSTIQIKNFQIPVPPLPEQTQIVNTLDKAFKQIDQAKANLEKNLNNAKELFQSKLNEVFSQRGEGWKEKALLEITTKITDGVHKKPNYTDEGIPFIKINNLTKSDSISFENVSYISEADHIEYSKRTKPEKGDILITKDGTIGVVRVIKTDIEFSIFVSVALIKPILKEHTPYLKYVLISPLIQNQIKPQGTALKHLYLRDLRKFVIPMPSLDEQKEIVYSLEILEENTKKLETHYQQKLNNLEELKKSILQKAFRGEL